MAYPSSHPLLREQVFSCSSNSLGSTPLAAAIRAPYRGRVVLCSGVTHGALTTADCSVAIAIVTSVASGTAPGAGTAITGSPMVLGYLNSAAGTSATMTPSGANIVAEGDLITFTPSGASGTTIGGTFYATIQAI